MSKSMQTSQPIMVANPKTRGRIYVVMAAVLGVLGMLGIINTDELDAGALADDVVNILGALSLIMARLNVWLRKPQLPPAPPR